MSADAPAGAPSDVEGPSGTGTGSARVAVREDLAAVAPYGAPQLDVPVRLNTNEPPEPPPASFDRALARRLADVRLNRYPDREAVALRTALGARAGLPAEQVWVAGGSNEVLLQLWSAYGGPRRRLLLFTPGYSAHPFIARAAATPVVTADLDADLTLSPATAAAAVAAHRPDIVCIASPNAPTGVEVPFGAVRALHDAGNALVVLDGAYAEFGTQDPRPLLDELPRLVWVRTFSKAWRLAGARLGYAYGPAWVFDDVRRVRLPYHLDALAQAAGLAALDTAADVTAHIPAIVAERARLVTALAGLGAHTWPTGGNFVLFRVPDRSGRGLFEALLARGVLVRDFSAVERLTGALRVTVGTRGENDAFLHALEAALDDPVSRSGP